MRYLPMLLRKLFTPVHLQSAPPMETPAHRSGEDTLARELHAAVDEHLEVAAKISTSYGTRLRSTIDELLEQIGSKVDDKTPR